MKNTRYSSLFLLIILVISIFLTSSNYAYAEKFETSMEKAQSILDQLTVEEKIGQLFYITLPGNTIEEIEAAWGQINHIPVGGIYLSVDNNNFSNEPDALQKIAQITNNIQLSGFNQTIDAPEKFPNYIPLFLGFTLDGENDAYFSSLTSTLQFPSLMAVGATWDNEIAYRYGEALGNTFSSLGFNFFDGLSLDLVAEPTNLNQNLIGTQSFGGNPFWVSQLGAQVVHGIKIGSENKLVVIAKHFPEISHGDRDPNIEIPTISRSLNEMEQIELLPYQKVTGLAIDNENRIDGLSISPVRYQGLQGDVLSTTKPIVFDQQGLDTFLSIPALQEWSNSTGLIISTELNSQSIRHYDDPQGQMFNAPSIARDALIAGNDILKFELGGNLPNALNYDEFSAVNEFFIQKYSEDVAFAERVDQALLKIIQKKFDLYPVFEIQNVINEEFIEINEDNDTLFFNINRNAISLISPTKQELDNSIPLPPDTSEKILIFTEMEFISQCMGCEPIPKITSTKLEESILSLYGSEGAESVFASYVNSYPFSYLETMLNDETYNSEMDILFNSSDWIIFLLSDSDDEKPDALSKLLSDRPDLLERKTSIAFSMGTPNNLDTTAISKLSAYYALYSENRNVLDIVTRIIFKEINPNGESPISIPSIGYYISEATSPDVEKIIPLEIKPIYTEDQSALATQSAEDPSLIEYHVGDPIHFSIGEIQDKNGNPVPDGTAIRIEISYSQEGAQYNNEIFVNTNKGLASLTYLLEYAGSVEAQVFSEISLSTSEMIVFNVLGSGEVAPALTPLATLTPIPTETPTLTPTPPPTATNTPEPTNTPIPFVTNENGEIIPVVIKQDTNFFDWLIMLLLSAFFAFAVYNLWTLTGNIRWAVRSAFFTFMLNSFGNAYLSLGLPGSKFIIQSMGLWGYILLMFILSLISVGIAYFLYKKRK